MANGCFLHQGQVVRHSDGTSTVIQEDSIYLTNALTASHTLWEESLHQWQYHNCLQIPLVSLNVDAVNSGMEFQADVIEYMMGFENFMKEGTIFSVVLSFEVSSFISSCYDEELGKYNISSLVAYFEEHYKAPDNFDFHWNEVIEMFFGDSWAWTNF